MANEEQHLWQLVRLTQPLWENKLYDGGWRAVVQAMQYGHDPQPIVSFCVCFEGG